MIRNTIEQMHLHLTKFMDYRAKNMHTKMKRTLLHSKSHERPLTYSRTHLMIFRIFSIRISSVKRSFNFQFNMDRVYSSNPRIVKRENIYSDT